MKMLISGYAPPNIEGVQLYDFHQDTGTATLLCGLKGISNPSFLAIHPDNRYFYAVSEEDDNKAALYAVEIATEGSQMRIVNAQPTKGGSPCYVTLFPREQGVFTANYGGGSFTFFPIHQPTGALFPPTSVRHFQDFSRIHCVAFTPDQRYFLVNDLGTHQVMVFNAEHPELPPVCIATGSDSGPRHITFSPSGKYAYLITEKSGEVIVFQYDGTPQLKIIQRIACDSVNAHGSADIHISDDGKFLYASNRLKNDGIAIYRMDSRNGLLTPIGYQPTGIHPRNFALSPDNRFLLCACRDDNEVQIFKRDTHTGLLQLTPHTIQAPAPTCIQFLL